ncbi:C2H2 type zinc finger domain-containing protein, partial [Colletotrichum asianum]
YAMAANENEPPTPREEQPWSQSQRPPQADTRNATSDNQHHPASPVSQVANELDFPYASPNLMFPIESFDLTEMDLDQQQIPSHPVQPEAAQVSRNFDDQVAITLSSQQSVSLTRRGTIPGSGRSTSSISDMAAPSNNAVPPKTGTRFSRDTARLLKQWLTTHSHYPYPSQADRQSLQLSTGLSKTKISNWLSNARRRQKSLANTTPARSPWSDESGAQVPRRPDTPIPSRTCTENHYLGMDPMERWVDSPPEDEPAAVDDIARAIASGNPSASSWIRPIIFHGGKLSK